MYNLQATNACESGCSVRRHPHARCQLRDTNFFCCKHRDMNHIRAAQPQEENCSRHTTLGHASHSCARTPFLSKPKPSSDNEGANDSFGESFSHLWNTKLGVHVHGAVVRTASIRAHLGREQKSFMEAWDIGLFRARSTHKGIRARGQETHQCSELCLLSVTRG